MRVRLASCVIGVVAGVTMVAAGQGPTDEARALLQRAAAYVDQYQSDLTAIVAEERYVQDVRTTFGASRTSTRSANVATHVDLLSDLIFVRTAGDERWMQYRDVFQVDGRAVRDRSERLMKLLATADADQQRQVDDITQESARYNIGPARRTLNMPMLALLFLTRDQQPRVQFIAVSAGNVSRLATATGTSDIRAYEYREGKNGTMIKGAYDRDMPSRGRFWIDAVSGAVLRSEMIVEDPTVSDRIDVTYGYDESLQMLVPTEMRETLSIRLDNTRVEGRATYRRFRRFSVQTDEVIDAPPAR